MQPRLAGAQNAFLTKLDTNGHVIFSTYLGGSSTDAANAIQADSAGNIYVAGSTWSLDFPTTAGTFQPSPVVPLWNNFGPGGFMAKLTPDAGALAYSSYVMSADHEIIGGIPQFGVTSLAVTSSGEAYLAGSTGAGYPVTPSAPQVCFSGSTDLFVAHLDSQGALLEATYVGGPGDEIAGGLGVANDGAILLEPLTGTARLLRIRFGGPGWTAPACLSPEALNAATFQGAPGVAPGEFISVSGFGIGPDQGVAYQPDVQGRPPQQLAGVQVLFDGVPAPLLYAQSRQVNAIAPFELSGKTSTNISVVYNGVTVGTATPNVIFASPGIFRLQPGISSQAAALNQDGTINGPSNPAAPGSVVAVWGTGFGSIDPPCATGGLNPPGPVNLASGLSVDIDVNTSAISGTFYPASYAGSAPTLLCGVEQINMLVPTWAQPGVFLFFPEVVMAIPGGHTSAGSSVGVTIAVK